MARRETVCAVVVTFNRKEMLLECLEALRKQSYPLDAIYVIDNCSTDSTPALLHESGYIPGLPGQSNQPQEIGMVLPMLSNPLLSSHMYYVRMHENTGGSGGFYEGVRRGSSKGFDWLWLMDDDAEPTGECLQNLMLARSQMTGGEISFLAPINVDREGAIQESHRGWLRTDKWQITYLPGAAYRDTRPVIEIGYTSFVGPLVSSRAVARVGFPDREFFIHYDDIEYCARLATAGRGYLVKAATILHKDKLYRDYQRSEEVQEDFWRLYYGKRNFVLIYKKYRTNRLLLWPELALLFMREAKFALSSRKYPIERLAIVVRGYLHGALGLKGKRS